MKFKKLDDYTIRCVLSEDDMIENDIEIEDFFSNREKIHHLMETIIDKAKNEVGYEIQEEILSMQVMPLPKNGLAITISGKKDQEISDMLSDVKNLKSILDEVAGEDQEEDSEDISGFMETLDNLGLFDAGPPEKKALHKSAEAISNLSVKDTPKKEELKEKADKKDGVRVYRFRSLKDIEGFCSIMQKPKYITSHLYKDNEDNVYYLVLEQGRLTTKSYRMACARVIEFADWVSSEYTGSVFVSEHCELLIKKNAVSTLRKIASV